MKKDKQIKNAAELQIVVDHILKVSRIMDNSEYTLYEEENYLDVDLVLSTPLSAMQKHKKSALSHAMPTPSHIHNTHSSHATHTHVPTQTHTPHNHSTVAHKHAVHSASKPKREKLIMHMTPHKEPNPIISNIIDFLFY